MRPRVLHVVEAVEAGVARHVRDIVRCVDAEHIVVAAPRRVGGFTDRESLDAMEAAGAQVHWQRMRRMPVHYENAAALARVRRLIRSTQPQIVHGHASIGGVVARAAAVKTKVARVYTPNGLMPSRAVLAVERALGRGTDRLIAVSETEAELAASLRIVPLDRIVVIPNGIDLEPAGPATADLRALLGVDRSTPLVGTVGRLARQKAPEIFVRACARILEASPDARFVLIGEGPLRTLVDTEVKTARLDGVFLHLPGLPRSDTVMDQLDVFVLASRYEGGPLAPLAAMRAGVPVVLTDVVGNRDTIEHERSGLLVPPENPGALADAVVRLLTEPALRQRCVEGARARLEDRFTLREMATRLSRVYRSLSAQDDQRTLPMMDSPGEIP